MHAHCHVLPEQLAHHGCSSTQLPVTHSKQPVQRPVRVASGMLELYLPCCLPHLLGTQFRRQQTCRPSRQRSIARTAHPCTSCSPPSPTAMNQIVALLSGVLNKCCGNRASACCFLHTTAAADDAHLLVLLIVPAAAAHPCNGVPKLSISIGILLVAGLSSLFGIYCFDPLTRS